MVIVPCPLFVIVFNKDLAAFIGTGRDFKTEQLFKSTVFFFSDSTIQIAYPTKMPPIMVALPLQYLVKDFILIMSLIIRLKY